jgi:PleD family two-component response regulator
MLKSFFSISVGIRCFEPSQDVNVENLIARADEALYKNKQSGR